MKFRCTVCRAIFYSDEPLEVCSLCSGALREERRRWEYCVCVDRGVEVELHYGIPACEHFVLNNAPGSRCTYFALPRRCHADRLPEYQPRTGIVPGADH
ncbi:TPA: hypothetical protein EYP12_07880 [Candidatus Bipolaricaulota bacterium]|nr:hypothetical protein [Candidatus Bipolaricaulota bacterium]